MEYSEGKGLSKQLELCSQYMKNLKEIQKFENKDQKNPIPLSPAAKVMSKQAKELSDREESEEGARNLKKQPCKLLKVLDWTRRILPKS